MHAIFDITKRSYRPNYACTRLQLKLIMSIEFTQVYRLVSCRLITLVRDFHKKLSSNVHKFTGLFHVDPIMHVRKKLSCQSNAHKFTGLCHVDLKRMYATYRIKRSINHITHVCELNTMIANG